MSDDLNKRYPANRRPNEAGPEQPLQSELPQYAPPPSYANPLPPQQQPQPAPYYAPQPVSSGNGFAVASLVLGIIGVAFFWLWFISPVLDILAIVFGRRGLNHAAATGQPRGVAMAGYVLGIIGVSCWSLFVLFLIIALAVH